MMLAFATIAREMLCATLYVPLWVPFVAVSAEIVRGIFAFA
jgi:hypothetical protein